MRTRIVHVLDSVPDAVYIGRPVPRHRIHRHVGSVWANPYRIGRDGDRAAVIAQYRALVERWLHEAPEVRLRGLAYLAGKPLACWCRHDGEARTPDNACHGDVLIELIQELGLETASHGGSDRHDRND